MKRKIELTVVIPGAARGKQSARGGSAGRRAHMPEATKAYEAWCRAQAIHQVGRQLLAGPLGLSLEIGVGVPPSWSERRRAAALADGGAWVTTKPDCSNITKAIEDAMKGVLWLDDAQVAELGPVRKRYSAEPQTILTVWTLEETTT